MRSRASIIQASELVKAFMGVATLARAVEFLARVSRAICGLAKCGGCTLD